jgi:hypothetical protein
MCHNVFFGHRENSMSVIIRYKKHKVTGILAGLTVDAQYTVPDMEHAIHDKRRLTRMTEEEPAVDAGSHSLFWVSDITLIEDGKVSDGIVH